MTIILREMTAEKYKITFGKHVINSWPAIVLMVVATVGIIADSMGFYEQSIIELFVVFLLLILVPTMSIHLNYYYVNKGNVLLYDKRTQDFELIIKGQSFIFNVEDISKVIYNKSFALRRKDIHFLPWDGYNHAVVMLNDGRKFVITSLLVGAEIVLPVHQEIIEIKSNMFRIAPVHNTKHALKV